MTIKTFEAFTATVDPEKATVVSFPEFIVVFGGALSKQTKPARPKSQRDAFVRWVNKNRPDLKDVLLIPEDYVDWSSFNTYSDLLLFEKDLGYLTSAVLVFLEGPGALAELGAFSQIASLSERLVVVVGNNHHPKNSFISLGPIRSIGETQGHSSSICVIPKIKPEDLDPHVPTVIDALDEKRKKTKVSARFDKGNDQHQILLILDLVNLFLLVTVTELQSSARHLGVDLQRFRLDQILFVLEKAKLITRQHYGRTTYYMPGFRRHTYINYTSFGGSTPFNRDRTKAERLAEINADSQRKIAYELGNKGVR